MHALPIPGLLFGAYPERENERQRTGADHSAAAVAARAAHLAGTWEALSDAALFAHLPALRQALSSPAGWQGSSRVEALAFTSETIRRCRGLRLHVVQLQAASAILDQSLAEMATGEGKTLAAGVAAICAGLAGIPVHVLTANDYLVERDAAQLATICQQLGLTIGWVTGTMDDSARRHAYAQSIVYVTARELIFDYLRDRVARGNVRHDLSLRARQLDGTAPALRLRGLCMAILDEADSLLLDDASTPFVLSRPSNQAEQRVTIWHALRVARLLDAADFVQTSPHSVQLSESGRQRCALECEPLGGRWAGTQWRESWVERALAACHAFLRDRDYLVDDGRIVIIDPNTGRPADGRVWSNGLHNLVEAKEGCRLTASTDTVAQLSFQQFFPRYHHLGGLSGTLHEARRELADVYGLSVVRIPLHQPARRTTLRTRLFIDHQALDMALGERIATLRASGRPVLVGTNSVEASERLAAHLTERGIPHQVLNARQNSDEARRIALAGVAGAITISTNMAGRGTDIALAPGVAERGGLHVISCQHNRDRRLDRQLAGRAARHGEPGSVETWITVNPHWPIWFQMLARRLARPDNGEIRVPGWLLDAWIRHRQAITSHEDVLQRRHMIDADEARLCGLSLAGYGE